MDRDIINAKFDIIQKDIEFAKELASKEFGFMEEQAAKYTLLEMVEACIDIASHIIASDGLRRAEEYSELFTVLREQKIIGENLAKRLAAMAKMRNILVHRYADVDIKRLRDALKNDLGDVEQFMRAIARYMEGEK